MLNHVLKILRENCRRFVIVIKGVRSCFLRLEFSFALLSDISCPLLSCFDKVVLKVMHLDVFFKERENICRPEISGKLDPKRWASPVAKATSDNGLRKCKNKKGVDFDA